MEGSNILLIFSNFKYLPTFCICDIAPSNSRIDFRGVFIFSRIGAEKLLVVCCGQIQAAI